MSQSSDPSSAPKRVVHGAAHDLRPAEDILNVLNTTFGLSGSLRSAAKEPPVTNSAADLSPTERIAFHQKIAMVGYGVYGKAIHSRLGSSFDILPWERKRDDGFNSDGVVTDLAKAIDGRGMLMLAVPSNAFPSVLDKIRPHKDTVVVSFAKGLIVPGWNPLASEKSLREGPEEGALALTPLEYIRQHPNWRHVGDNLVFVGGPGFAKDVQEGGFLGLTLSGRGKESRKPTEALAKAFWVFSGMSGDKNVEVYDNPTALEIAASMKNVAAFAAGIILGILKKNEALELLPDGGFKVTKRVTIAHGEHKVTLDDKTLHRLTHFASREIVNVVKSEGGGKGAQLTMAGNHDLNLTVNSLTSRNVQAGMRLACGESIYEILTKRDANGHLLTAEGVVATHAMACRIQNNRHKTPAFAPLVFAVRSILMNQSSPEDVLAKYFAQTKEWTEGDAHKFMNGLAKPMGLRTHSETKRSRRFLN